MRIFFYAGQSRHCLVMIRRRPFEPIGIISLVVRLTKGADVEAAMVGRDGEFGAGAALSGDISASTAIVQMAGKVLTIDVALLRIAAE